MKKIFVIAILLLELVFANPICTETKEVIGALESRNDYTTLSEGGFVGKYQFGAMNLVDIGLIDANKYQKATYLYRLGDKNKVMWKKGNHKTFLQNKTNWLNGLSLETFLSSQNMQDETIIKSCELTIKRLESKKIDTSNQTALKAMIVAAHLGGVESVERYISTGKDYSDAFGTKLSKYFVAGAGSIAAAKKAKAFLGSRYVWGGTTPEGFDCSGYVQYLYAKEGIALPRTALAQSKVGEEVSPNALKEGDLLFFLTDKKRGIPVTHVGIYQDEGKFIHAASKKEGVIVSSLSEYKNRLVVAKRVIPRKDNLQVFTAVQTKTKTAPTNTMKIALNFDSYVIKEGRYIKQSQSNQ